MGVVGRGGDRQYLADRLDPMRPTMIVDEAEARGLPFERLQLLGRVGRNAGRCPLSTSAFLTQSCSVCGVQPILAAIDVTAAQRDGCSLA